MVPNGTKWFMKIDQDPCMNKSHACLAKASTNLDLPKEPPKSKTYSRETEIPRFSGFTIGKKKYKGLIKSKHMFNFQWLLTRTLGPNQPHVGGTFLRQKHLNGPRIEQYAYLSKIEVLKQDRHVFPACYQCLPP